MGQSVASPVRAEELSAATADDDDDEEDCCASVNAQCDFLQRTSASRIIVFTVLPVLFPPRTHDRDAILHLLAR